MPIIFIRYILPVLVLIFLQIKLSFMDNKWYGLIIPAISVAFTIILANNAFELLGTIFALTIMAIPNILSIGLYVLVKNIKKKQDEHIIKLKFGNKK